MAPELHYKESGTHIPWIDNLIGNIRGAKDQLITGNYISEKQYSDALNELEELRVMKMPPPIFTETGRGRGNRDEVKGTRE
jgi:hypothetical protein